MTTGGSVDLASAESKKVKQIRLCLDKSCASLKLQEIFFFIIAFF